MRSVYSTKLWVGMSAIAVAVFCLVSTVALSRASRVTFSSPCEAEGIHGVARWAAKTDTEQPPNPNDAQPEPITPVTPSDVFSWRAPSQTLTEHSARIPEEQQWFALTGRINKMKVEQDGDVHIELIGSSNESVVVEIPSGPTWCELRRQAFSWTEQRFPFSFESGKILKLGNVPKLVTVVGKAFYDVDHAKKGTNRRVGEPKVAVWEIHPVMQITRQ